MLNEETQAQDKPQKCEEISDSHASRTQATWQPFPGRFFLPYIASLVRNARFPFTLSSETIVCCRSYYSINNDEIKPQESRTKLPVLSIVSHIHITQGKVQEHCKNIWPLVGAV